jgi:glycosyltransferase involved in cell wall biosynthesis
MPTQKKLLIISNRYPTTVDDIASPFVRDFHLALKDNNIFVDIVTPYYKSPAGEIRYTDKTVHFYNWSDGSKVISQLPLYHPKTFLKINKYFKNGFLKADLLFEKNQYDAIMALWAAPSGIIARKLAKKYDVPYSVWALGSDINSYIKLPLVGRMIIKVLKEADILFADGNELAQKVRSLTDKSCRFLPSFHPINIEFGNNIKKQKMFVCVGRIEQSKGVFDLLKAFKLFHKNNPEYHLKYVGTGRGEEQLRHLIKSSGLEDNVEALGYKRREEINSLMLSSKAVIIPSHSDSLPLTFGEAMQARLQVICSEVGDMPYFIDRYDVGFHYPVGDIKQLTELMHLLANNEYEFSHNSENILKELSIENSARTVNDWLSGITSDKIETRKSYAGC